MSFDREALNAAGSAFLAEPERAKSPDEDIQAYLARHYAREHPPLLRALSRDAMVFAYHRGESAKLHSKTARAAYALLLPFRCSEYLAMMLYRLRVALRRAHLPILPGILNWTCAIGWGIRIDDLVIVDQGVYMAHGEVVIAGPTYIGPSCYLSPYVSIGLVQGNIRAPELAEGVFVGTGARILGPVNIGYGARIGANAVVLQDVPAWTTAVGVPARLLPITDKASQVDEA